MTFDLREGVESAIKKDKNAKSEKLDKLLEWILINKAAFAAIFGILTQKITM